jgi:hypothetical protein
MTALPHAARDRAQRGRIQDREVPGAMQEANGALGCRIEVGAGGVEWAEVVAGGAHPASAWRVGDPGEESSEGGRIPAVDANGALDERQEMEMGVREGWEDGRAGQANDWDVRHVAEASDAARLDKEGRAWRAGKRENPRMEKANAP